MGIMAFYHGTVMQNFLVPMVAWALHWILRWSLFQGFAGRSALGLGNYTGMDL